jgi:hypothetical protein
VNARQLQSYAVEQALAHQSEIAPELMDYVGGDSKTAIDASIAKAKAASSALVQRALQGQIRPHDTDDPAYVAAAAANAREGFGGQQVPDVGSMTMQEFAEYRRVAGIGQNNGGGIFGPVGR